MAFMQRNRVPLPIHTISAMPWRVSSRNARLAAAPFRQ